MASPAPRVHLQNIAQAPRRLARKATAFLRERTESAQQQYNRELQGTLIAFRQVADRRTAQRVQEHLALGYRVLDQLERAGLAVMVLGEFATAHSAYEGSEKRQPSFLNLLLTPGERLPAEKALTRMGFLVREPGVYRHPGGLQVRAHDAFLPGLHAETGTALVRRYATSVRFAGVPLCIPCPTHQLIYVCCAPATSADPSRKAEDTRRLAISGKVDWRRALRHAETLGVLTALCSALIEAGVDPLLARVDPSVLRRIQDATGRSWTAEETQRQVNHGSVDQGRPVREQPPLVRELVATLRTLVDREFLRLSSSLETTLRTEIRNGVRLSERFTRRTAVPAASWLKEAFRRALAERR